MVDNEISIWIRLKDSFTEGSKKIGDNMKDLAEKSEKMLMKAGLSFAGLSVEIAKATDAARESELATAKLNTALANQGNYTKQASEDLQDYANVMMTKSLFDDDEIINAEAIMAAYGMEGDQIKELTKVTLDLAQAKGMDLASAADMVARTVGSSTNALARQGIAVEGAAGSMQRAQSVVKGLSNLYDGQAEAATRGLGATVQFKNVMGNFQEQIGFALAPAISAITGLLSKLVQVMMDHPIISKMVAAFMLFAVVLTGLVSAIGAIAAILPVITTGFGILGAAIAMIGGPITLIIAAVGLLTGAFFLFKTQMMNVVAFVTNSFLDMVKGILTGIEFLLQKMQILFNLLNKIPGVKIDTQGAIDGLDKIKDKLESMKMKYTETAEHAKKANDDIYKNNTNNVKAAQQMDDDTFNKKKQQLDLWVSQQQAAGTYTLENHIKHLNNILAAEDLTTKQRNELEIARNNLIAQNDDMNFKKKLALLDNWATKKKAAGTYEVQDHIAKLNEMFEGDKLNSEQKLQLTQMTDELLIELQKKKAEDFAYWENFMKGAVTSKNKEVAAIAKAMAIYEIGINTYKAAMAAYSAMAGIPFIGPVLGIAAAAAAVAYGGEQIANVQNQVPQLAEGALIKGSGTGTLVNVGEPGPRGSHDEVLFPLDDPEIARRIQQAAGAGGDLYIEMKVGEDKLANIMVKSYNKARNLKTAPKLTSA